MAHRLNSKLFPPPITAMLHSRTKKEPVVRHLEITLQDLDMDLEENNTIYVNESLTIRNSILFKKARDTCKNNEFKFYWTTNGKILCKKIPQNQLPL